MADYTDVLVVPEEEADQSPLYLPPVLNPWLAAYWTQETVVGVPENTMGWLVAQGWQITGVSNDTSTNPPTTTYTLGKPVLSPQETLLGLCNNYTSNAQRAQDANEVRYNQVVIDWNEMIASSQTQFVNQTAKQNADFGVYIADLKTYMDAIDTLTEANADNLSNDYTAHKSLSQGLLTSLGTAEVARINELFAATLSVQLQGLTDRGIYSSGVAADITARNTRDKDEELQKHYDSLAREQNSNEHVLWNEKLALASQNNTAITQKMNTSVMRLEGWKSVAADNQRLMAYQLDTRNQLITGLYSFVERRNDLAPEWKDMSKMFAGLADSAGGWISP